MKQIIITNILVSNSSWLDISSSICLFFVYLKKFQKILTDLIHTVNIKSNKCLVYTENLVVFVVLLVIFVVCYFSGCCLFFFVFLSAFATKLSDHI